MNETIELKTIDNHKFDAFISCPDTKPKGGLVVIQEIFGVNNSIKEIAKSINTIPYEILSSISQRVVRIYEKE